MFLFYHLHFKARCGERVSLFTFPEIYPSTSSVFPDRSLGFTIFGEICSHVTVSYPTTEIVTFLLHGWCMLGPFLLLTFTHLGLDCQGLLSLYDGMHAHTRPQFILLPKRVVGSGMRMYVNFKGKKTQIDSSEERLLAMLLFAGQQTQHTTNQAILSFTCHQFLSATFESVGA